MKKTLLKTGIIGSIITAICCVTPVLGILAGFMGLSMVVPYLDFVLLPALAIFVMITLYAVYKGANA